MTESLVDIIKFTMRLCINIIKYNCSRPLNSNNSQPIDFSTSHVLVFKAEY